MAEQFREAVSTITPDGGSIDRGSGNGHRGGNGRNGNRRGGTAENRPSDESPSRPAQGALVVEGKSTRLEGDRETIKPEVYYDQRTLTTLRGLIAHLTDSEQVVHYNSVVENLSLNLNIDEDTKDKYEERQSHLDEIGGIKLADEVKGYYQDQLRKSLLIIDGYVEATISTQVTPERLEQEKAVLVYAEFLLSRLQIQSVHYDDVEKGKGFDFGGAVGGLGVNDEKKRALASAFTHMANFGDFSYIQCCNKVIDQSDTYVPPDDPAVPDGTVRLDSDVVNTHLRRSNDQAEGAHRLVVDALDRLNESVRQERIEQREQNPEINLNEQPFSTWEARIAERNGVTLQADEHLSSEYCVNTLLGKEKSEQKILGIQGRHSVKHAIRTVDHKAPVRQVGGGKERLENVQAVEISLMAGVYQGEWNQGKTLQPGESRPKEFFERVVDVTVWSVSLNSADKVENFADQLLEAEALVMNGTEVVRVLGRYEEGVEDQEIINAQAFRVPVVNHRGEPTFIIVDRKTMVEMMRVVDISRSSYAKLAERDDRYRIHPREERWAAFRPQLKQHENTPESWVDQERDCILVERMSQERIMALRGTNNEVDGYAADQLSQALKGYRAQFNEFQMNYCRISRYRELAVGRLTRIGITKEAPDYQNLLRGEMNAVALEYINRWNAFRDVTTRLLISGNTENLSTEEIEAMQLELTRFLANIDYELEIQVRASSTDISEWDLRTSLTSFMRLVPPQTIDGMLPETAYGNYRNALHNNNPSSHEVYEPLRILEKLTTENSQLDRDAGGHNEARRVLNVLQTLYVKGHKIGGGPLSVSEADLFESKAEELMPRLGSLFLTRAYTRGDLVYPENRLSAEAVQAIRDQSTQLEDLLGRKPTDVEINRFLDCRQEIVAQRTWVVETLRDVGESRKGLIEINGYLSSMLEGKDLAALSPDELVDLSCMVYASVRTLVNMPEVTDADSLLGIYNGFLNEAVGVHSATSDAIRRRVHDRIEALQATPQP